MFQRSLRLMILVCSRSWAASILIIIIFNYQLILLVLLKLYHIIYLYYVGGFAHVWPKTSFYYKWVRLWIDFFNNNIINNMQILPQIGLSSWSYCFIDEINLILFLIIPHLIFSWNYCWFNWENWLKSNVFEYKITKYHVGDSTSWIIVIWNRRIFKLSSTWLSFLQA